MVQNRNNLIELFIGNGANAVVHRVLEMAAKDEDLSQRYNKELTTSREIAKRYREKINPITKPLQIEDQQYVAAKIISKAKAELRVRIAKGYQDIDLNLIEKYTEELLKALHVM